MAAAGNTYLLRLLFRGVLDSLFREQRVKSCYAKMIVRRQRIREAKLFHHHKTYAIRERKLLIEVLQQ
jgi:hypothetical protein